MKNKKLILVTGATKGLGLATSKILLEKGYKVIAVGRTKSIDIEELERKYKGSIFYESFDFSNIADIHEFSRTVTKKYGRSYGLVNNAALGHDGVLATMHESDINDLITVNVRAPIVLTKYIIRGMLIERAGRIVNVSSIIASTGFNGLAVYGATKAALEGFTKSLSREVGKANITVNSVAPGYMETAMTASLQGEKLKSIKRRSPLGRLATVNDVAHGIVYLLSEEAGSVTGTCLTIDAGSTA